MYLFLLYITEGGCTGGSICWLYYEEWSNEERLLLGNTEALLELITPSKLAMIGKFVSVLQSHPFNNSIYIKTG